MLQMTGSFKESLPSSIAAPTQKEELKSEEEKVGHRHGACRIRSSRVGMLKLAPASFCSPPSSMIAEGHHLLLVGPWR